MLLGQGLGMSRYNNYLASINTPYLSYPPNCNCGAIKSQVIRFTILIFHQFFLLKMWLSGSLSGTTDAFEVLKSTTTQSSIILGIPYFNKKVIDLSITDQACFYFNPEGTCILVELINNISGYQLFRELKLSSLDW